MSPNCDQSDSPKENLTNYSFPPPLLRFPPLSSFRTKNANLSMLIRCPVCSAQCNCYLGCRTGKVRALDHLGGPYKVIPVFVQTDKDTINNSNHDRRNNKRHAFPLTATMADPGNVVTVFFHYRDAVAYALVVTGMRWGPTD